MEGNRIHFDHSGGNQNNQQIWNDGSDFRFYTTSTKLRIQHYRWWWLEQLPKI